MAQAKERIIKRLYTVSDNIDIWIQEHFNVNAKQKALEWRQDNISHKLGDRRINEALGIWKIKKDHQEKKKRNQRRRTNK